MFEAAQDGILIVDPVTATIVDVNPYLIRLLGYPLKHFIGTNLWETGLFSDVDTSRIAFRDLQTKKYVRFDDLPLKCNDGKAIHVEFISNVYGVKGKQVIQCTVRDISSRKQFEEAGQRLLQAQKMEAVGQLAGEIAHDFNTYLQIILGYGELLQGHLDLPHPVLQMIESIQVAGTSAQILTRRLLAFSRQETLQPVILDLNGVVTRTQLLLRTLIGANIALDCSLSKDLGTIQADPHQIEQVVMNLALNARDAMPDGGQILFETANVEIDDKFQLQQPVIEAGQYVILAVGDTGIGMDPWTQSHIFEPFFTTKLLDNGTGLGLSTVFNIVKESGGAISVFSQPDHGTKFTVYFPRREEPSMISEPVKSSSLHAGSETILLVDDSPSTRMLLRIFLEHGGYTVLEAGDPVEALRISREFKGHLPLTITDMIMPGFSGPALAQQLALDRPGTRVIYMSGNPEDASDRHDIGGLHHGFLQKPFTCDDLVAKVRQVLDSPRTVSDELGNEIKRPH